MKHHMHRVEDQPAHHHVQHGNAKHVALLELLKYRQVQQRVMGVRADFAFQAFDLARQGFALLFCSHGVESASEG